jgi:cytochrome bd-type quinol oxidase subunit 2
MRAIPKEKLYQGGSPGPSEPPRMQPFTLGDAVSNDTLVQLLPPDYALALFAATFFVAALLAYLAYLSSGRGPRRTRRLFLAAAWVVLGVVFFVLALARGGP